MNLEAPVALALLLELAALAVSSLHGSPQLLPARVALSAHLRAAGSAEATETADIPLESALIAQKAARGAKATVPPKDPRDTP